MSGSTQVLGRAFEDRVAEDLVKRGYYVYRTEQYKHPFDLHVIHRKTGARYDVECKVNRASVAKLRGRNVILATNTGRGNAPGVPHRIGEERSTLTYFRPLRDGEGPVPNKWGAPATSWVRCDM